MVCGRAEDKNASTVQHNRYSRQSFTHAAFLLQCSGAQCGRLCNQTYQRYDARRIQSFAERNSNSAVDDNQENTSLPIAGAFDLSATLWLMSMGSGNPCLRADSPTQVRMGLQTSAGPVGLRVSREAETLKIGASGPGAGWITPHLRGLFGLNFEVPKLSGLRKLRQIAYDLRGLRLVRMPMVYTPLVQIILQQLISYRDACHGWRQLAKRYGAPVPGHDDLWFPPAPNAIAKLHSHHFVECDILPQHGRRIVEVSRAADRIEAAWDAGRGSDAANRVSALLQDLPGIGPWTVGLLRGGALGDADAEVLCDYSMPKFVSYFFEEDLQLADQATDDDMLRLLEPYRPHRFYVLTLINCGAKKPPRRAPRRKSIRERF